jgi:hypothetical protein
MPRLASVQHLVDLLDPNPNLPMPLLRIAHIAAACRDELLAHLGDGPELSAGLRKLLEAKDCFVRQALVDQRESLPTEPPTAGYRAGGPNG